LAAAVNVLAEPTAIIACWRPRSPASAARQLALYSAARICPCAASARADPQRSQLAGCSGRPESAQRIFASRRAPGLWPTGTARYSPIFGAHLGPTGPFRTDGRCVRRTRPAGRMRGHTASPGDSHLTYSAPHNVPRPVRAGVMRGTAQHRQQRARHASTHAHHAFASNG
jgi:hypothetical protein